MSYLWHKKACDKSLIADCVHAQHDYGLSLRKPLVSMNKMSLLATTKLEAETSQTCAKTMHSM